MINTNGWAYNQKQKRAKEVKAWLVYWCSLVIVALLLLPIIWFIIVVVTI